MIVPSPVPLTVKGTGKVEIQNFVVVKADGHVVTEMSGVFDFTKVPGELHVAVINHLLRSRLTLLTTTNVPASVAPAVGPSTPAAALANTSKPWWRFWKE